MLHRDVVQKNCLYFYLKKTANQVINIATIRHNTVHVKIFLCLI